MTVCRMIPCTLAIWPGLVWVTASTGTFPGQQRIVPVLSDKSVRSFLKNTNRWCQVHVNRGLLSPRQPWASTCSEVFPAKPFPSCIISPGATPFLGSGNHLTEMCSGSDAGSYLRLTDSCITQPKAQGPSGTSNESQEGSGKHPKIVEEPRRSGNAEGRETLGGGFHLLARPGRICLHSVTISRLRATTFQIS